MKKRLNDGRFKMAVVLELAAKREGWDEPARPYNHYIVAGSSKGDTLLPVLHSGDVARQWDALQQRMQERWDGFQGRGSG